MAADASIKITDSGVREALERLRLGLPLGGSMLGAMQGMGRVLKTGAQLRFRKTESPEGQQWSQSWRARNEGKKTLSELKDANIKVGVPMSTPIDDYLFSHNIPRALYLDNRRIMQAMAAGEIDASLVWGTAIAGAKREYPDRKFHMVEGYVPEADQRWNLNFVVRKQDQSMMKFINDSVEELLASGKMKQIIESYNVPFYPPFS